MSLRRAPLFSWSMLVGGSVWLLVLPVQVATLLLAFLDMRYGPDTFGGASHVYDRIAWIFWQPTVYVIAVPALGIIGDIVPVFARRRHQRHRAAMFLIGLAASFGFGAWAQVSPTMDGSGSAPWLQGGPWQTIGFVAVLPVLGLLGLWTLTLGLGRPKLGTPMVLGVLSGMLVFLGIAGGIGTVVDAFDLDGTTWMTAQTLLVLIGAALAALAGVDFWAPKLYGKLLPAGLVRLGGTLVALGALVAAVPLAIAGGMGQARFVAGGISTVSSGDVSTVETLNLVSGIGLAVAVLGAVLVAGSLLARRRGDGPGDDPWEGHTLEWTTSSPPPIGNFATVPAITSEAPLYDARYAPASSTESTD